MSTTWFGGLGRLDAYPWAERVPVDDFSDRLLPTPTLIALMEWILMEWILIAWIAHIVAATTDKDAHPGLKLGILRRISMAQTSSAQCYLGIRASVS